MLGNDSKQHAAARRLAEAAELDVSVDPNLSQPSQIRLADSAAVVTHAAELIAAGELDGFIGNLATATPTGTSR